jgi:hypothetical protein
MVDHVLRFRGPGPQSGTVHYGPLLRVVLDALVDGCQQATRLLIEGRSSAQGTPPAWLEDAAAFHVRQLGMDEIFLQARPLGNAIPDMPGPIPGRSGLDLLEDSLDHAIHGVADSDLYDRSLIETFESFGRILQYGIDSVELVNGRTVRLDAESVRTIRHLRALMPDDRKLSLTGSLKANRYDDRRFELALDSGEIAHGIAVSAEARAAGLAALWGKRVVVSGLARFRPSGAILRIEAERIRPAGAPENVDAEIQRLVEEGRVRDARARVQGELDAGRGEAVRVWAKILAPPVAEPGSVATGRDDARLNQGWLEKHEAEHVGEWVALRDGGLVDSDKSLRALRQRLRANRQEQVLLARCGGAGDAKTGS